MKRRRPVLLILLLVGGAIVNVAVAWGCVMPLAILSWQNVPVVNVIPSHVDSIVSKWSRVAVSDWPAAPSQVGHVERIGAQRFDLSIGIGNRVFWLTHLEAGQPFASLDGGLFKTPGIANTSASMCWEAAPSGADFRCVLFGPGSRSTRCSTPAFCGCYS